MDLSADPLSPEETIRARKTRTVEAPGAGLRADGTLTKNAIEQIVVGGVQAAFMMMAAFTRPVEYQPAWQFSEREVKPCSDHFVRWLQTFEPEKLSVMAKYIDPALGCVAMYGLYTVARLREKELENAYADLVRGAPPAAHAGTDAAAGSDPQQNRGNGNQRDGTEHGSNGVAGLPRNFFC